MSGWGEPEAFTHGCGEWGTNERDSSSSSSFPPRSGGGGRGGGTTSTTTSSTSPSIASRRQQAPQNQAARSARGNLPRGSSSSSSSTMDDVPLSFKTEPSRFDGGGDSGTGTGGGGWMPAQSSSEVPAAGRAFDQRTQPKWGDERGDIFDNNAFDNSARGSWSMNQPNLNLGNSTQSSGGGGGWFASQFEQRPPTNLKSTNGARPADSSSGSFRADAAPYEPLDSVTTPTKASMAESSRRRRAQQASKVSLKEADSSSSLALVETETWNPDASPNTYSRWAPEGYVPPPVKYPIKVLRKVSGANSASPPASTAGGNTPPKAASSPSEANDLSTQIGVASPPPSPSLSKLRSEMFKPSDADTTRPRSDQATRDMFTAAMVEHNSRVMASLAGDLSESDLPEPGYEIKFHHLEKMFGPASFLDIPPHMKDKPTAKAATAARGGTGTRGARSDMRQSSSPDQESPTASSRADSSRTRRSASLGFVESPKPLESSASSRSATSGLHGSPGSPNTTPTKVGSLGGPSSSSTSALHGMKGLMDHLREMYAEKLELQGMVRSLERDLAAQHQRTSIAEAQARLSQLKAHDFEIRLLEAIDRRALLDLEVEDRQKQNQELRQRISELVTASEKRALAETTAKSGLASRDPEFDKQYKELEAANTALEKDKTALLADRSNLVNRLNASELDRASLTGRLLVAQQDAMEMGNQLALEQLETARSQKLEAAMARGDKSKSTEKEAESTLEASSQSTSTQEDRAARTYSQDELLALRKSPLIEQHDSGFSAATRESREALASARPEGSTFSTSGNSQGPSTDSISRNGTGSEHPGSSGFQMTQSTELEQAALVEKGEESQASGSHSCDTSRSSTGRWNLSSSFSTDSSPSGSNQNNTNTQASF